MAKGDEQVLRYLRSINVKLDRVNKRLDELLSAPKKKRASRTGDAVDPANRNILVCGTPKSAEALRKNNPDALIIITGVPRAGRDD
jgi:hypothetical protein